MWFFGISCSEGDMWGCFAGFSRKTPPHTSPTPPVPKAFMIVFRRLEMTLDKEIKTIETLVDVGGPVKTEDRGERWVEGTVSVVQ